MSCSLIELKERTIRLQYDLISKHKFLSSLNIQSYEKFRQLHGEYFFLVLAQYELSKEKHYQDIGLLMECIEQLYRLDPSIPQHIVNCRFFSHVFFFFKLKENTNEALIKISDDFLEPINLGIEILAYFLKSKKECAFAFIKGLSLSDRNKLGLAFTTLTLLLKDFEPKDSHERHRLTETYLEHFEMLDESEDPDPISHL